ncbi:Aste57867_14631 [Aphanomyces stellatus]|uniref:Aste57867_14631 protein n=1 Tax=Aphanomyces stellatus TaxID=120398 RepID=A0A485L1Z7_9STRA|nr:hypothetical protein As57867_014576 [Aphanomyces stellatus]VFT91450.1 Aste57867_14631 [Aphanomyces stellatus]
MSLAIAGPCVAGVVFHKVNDRIHLLNERSSTTQRAAPLTDATGAIKTGIHESEFDVQSELRDVNSQLHQIQLLLQELLEERASRNDSSAQLVEDMKFAPVDHISPSASPPHRPPFTNIATLRPLNPPTAIPQLHPLPLDANTIAPVAVVKARVSSVDNTKTQRQFKRHLLSLLSCTPIDNESNAMPTIESYTEVKQETVSLVPISIVRPPIDKPHHYSNFLELKLEDYGLFLGTSIVNGQCFFASAVGTFHGILHPPLDGNGVICDPEFLRRVVNMKNLLAHRAVCFRKEYAAFMNHPFVKKEIQSGSDLKEAVRELFVQRSKYFPTETMPELLWGCTGDCFALRRLLVNRDVYVFSHFSYEPLKWALEVYTTTSINQGRNFEVKCNQVPFFEWSTLFANGPPSGEVFILHTPGHYRPILTKTQIDAAFSPKASAYAPFDALFDNTAVRKVKKSKIL